MYQSAREQLIQAKKESANKRLISENIDQMVRNKMIQQGLQPIIVESESPDISKEKTYIMEILSRITTQPIKFYNYLFNTNQIELFSMTVGEFTRKFLKSRRNLSYDVLLREWNNYKKDPSGKNISPDDILNPRNSLYVNLSEYKDRLNLEKEEMESRERKKDLYDIGKTLINLRTQPPPPPPPPPTKMRITKETQELPPLSSIDKLMEELKDKIKHRKIEGIGIKKGKKNTRMIGLLIDPNKMTRKAMYPVNRNWSYV